MKRAGIVEEASSPWSANLVIVSKTDDQGRPVTPRVTIDFRGLNSITYKDKFPLPHIQDCLRSLDNSAFLSIFDVSNSYFQVPLSWSDRDKTAFLTRKGQFRFTRLVQGCCNSPAVFCRLMSLVLRGLTCCLAYIDDTVCHSPSFEAHLVDLESVFQRFRQANLKLKPTKCKLFQERMKFVGFVVSNKGLETDTDKIACIVNWPFPRTITELRGFLGLCSYYRSFCPNSARVADPLTRCLRKGVALSCTPERLAAFDELKRMLTTAPVLAMPRDDPQCTFVLDCDASGTAASSVLQQWQDGKLRVIEYASRTFTLAERAYCATRREMTALVFGLKQFRFYLLGRQFQVRVDNMALTYYKTMKDPTGQAARYLDFLSNYDFTLIHRSGEKHVNADSISRIRPCEVDGGKPCKQCNRRVQTRAQRQRVDEYNDDNAAETCREPRQTASPVQGGGREGKRRRRRLRRSAPSLEATAPQAWDAGIAGWSPEFVQDAQLRYCDIAPAVDWVENGQRPHWDEVETKSPMIRALWQQFESLVVHNGVLYRQFYNPSGLCVHFKLVLPSEMKVAFLELVHADAAGHLKFAKCVSHVARRAWWLYWKRDLKLFIKCCDHCEAFHRGRPPRQANLRATYAGAPGEKWATDLTGPHCMSN